MFQIISERLRLIPLTVEHLHLWAQSRATLEQHLGLELSNFELNADPAFIEEFNAHGPLKILSLVEPHAERYEWHTLWQIVHREQNLYIGGIGMNGIDENGQGMLGYYIDKKFEGQGLTTEALGCLLAWAWQNPDLKSVVADTLIAGVASQKVLQKNGFVLEGEVEEGLRWVLSRP